MGGFSSLPSLQRVSSQLKNIYKFRLFGGHQFRAKVNIECSVGTFVIKSAQSQKELIRALSHRHDLLVDKECSDIYVPGLDIDDYDVDSDHLVLIDQRYDQVIGVLRVRELYSEPKEPGTLDKHAVSALTEKVLHVDKICFAWESPNITAWFLLQKALYLYSIRTESSSLSLEVKFGANWINSKELKQVESFLNLIKPWNCQIDQQQRQNHIVYLTKLHREELNRKQWKNSARSLGHSFDSSCLA